jgi:hypothetical protein
LVRLRQLEIEREVCPTKRDPKDKPRAVCASTTDAEARVMKMPDGGFRPAYNVQVAGDPDSQVIVGVAVDTRGCDVGQLRPMLEQLQDRYGQTPSWYLADGGFCRFADIEWAWANDTAAVIPAGHGRDGKNPYAPQPSDGPGVTVWRELMSGALGQRMYRVRSQLECPCLPRCASGIFGRSWCAAAARCAASCCCTRSPTIYCVAPVCGRRLSESHQRTLLPVARRIADPSRPFSTAPSPLAGCHPASCWPTHCHRSRSAAPPAKSNQAENRKNSHTLTECGQIPTDDCRSLQSNRP